MKRKINILALATLACGILATSCANNEPDPKPQPQVETYALTLNKDAGVESISITSGGEEVTDLTRIEEETELTATITLLDKYELSAVTLDGEVVNVTGGTYVFDMPSKNVTLAVTTERVYDSSVEVTNDSAAGTYTLTVNGEVSDGTQIDSGDTVKIVVSPAEHHRLSTITVNGSEVSYTEGGYEFTAVEGKNTVELAYDEAHTIAYTSVDSQAGSLSLTNGTVEIYSGDYVFAGESLTLSLKSSYISQSSLGQYYFYIDGEVHHASEEGFELSKDNTTITYTFTSKDAATEIFVTKNTNYTTNETGLEITFEENEYIKVYGFEDSDKYNGNYLTFNFTKDPSYVITSLELTYDDGTKETFNVTDTSTIYYVDSVSFGQIMLQKVLTQGATIKIIGETQETQEITYVGLDGVMIDAGGAGFATKAIPGTTINVLNLVTKDSNSRIDNVTIESEGESVEGARFTAASSWSDASYSFTMPDAPVTITFDTKENGKITIEADENITNISVRSSTSLQYTEIKSAMPGTNFYVYFEVKDGYDVATVTDGEGTSYSVINTTAYDPSNGSYIPVSYVLAKMPTDGSDITLTLTSAEVYAIEVEESSLYSVSITGNKGSYAAGSTISFRARPASGLYKLTDVYLTDEEGTKLDVNIEKDITEVGYIDGSFVMPAQKVKIVCVAEKAEVLDLVITVDNKTSITETSELFNTFTISNYTSGVQINSYEDDLSAEFLPGSSTNASFGLSKNNLGASIAYTLKDGTTSEFPLGSISTYGGSRIYSFSSTMVPDDATGIVITVYEIDALKCTIRDKSGEVTEADLEFTVNDEKVTSLTDAVYEGSSVSVKVNKDAGSGYAYIVTYYQVDEDGKEKVVSPDWEGNVTFTSDFIIEITKVQASTSTFVNNSSVTGSIALFSSDYMNYYNEGDLIFGTKELIISVNFNMVSGSKKVNIAITVGGTEVVNEDVTPTSYGTYRTDPITVNGDVVVTMTDVE